MTAAVRAVAALGLIGVLALAGCTREPVAVQRSLPSTTAGSVLSTGLNDGGQLGRPAPTGMQTSFAPVTGPAGGGALTGAAAVAAGERHSLAVRSDGRVVAWGSDDHGQLGDGTRNDSRVPVFVRAPDHEPGQLHGAVAVGADTDFSMALLADGTVVTWGRGNTAQRGNGNPSADATSPVRVVDPTGSGPLRNVTQIAADGSTELALLRDGTVVGWGDNFYGQLGPGAPRRVLLPVRIRGADGAPLGRVTGIAVGGQHALALLADGRVLAWGHNDRYQLGDGSRRDRAAPGPVRGPGGTGELRDVVAVAAAEKHNAALRRDGTVVTWGNNTAGQLGAGTLRAVTHPVTVVGEQGPALLRSVRSVAVGEAYTVAICADGDVLTWGANSRGQLGSGNRGGRDRPGPVDTEPGVPFPLHITAAGAGQRHLLLLTR